MPKYNITTTLLQNLTAIESIKKSFVPFDIKPDYLASLRYNARILSTYSSMRMEGNRLTMEEVAAAVENPSADISREEKEVRSYYRALGEVERTALSGRKISESMIRRLHSLVEGKRRPSPYRETENPIRDNHTGKVVYIPPEAEQVPKLMSEFVEWISVSDSLATPIAAGISHYQFMRIHPYFDGNGRTARLLAMLVMYLGGYDMGGIYSVEEYYANDLQAYYNAFDAPIRNGNRTIKRDMDVTMWLEYYTGALSTSFQKARETVMSKKSARDFALRELNLKQRKILELFEEFQEVSAAQIAEYMEVSARSAAALSKEWISEGFLVYANTSKKARSYRLSPKYERLVISIQKTA
ncbi:Fic family protein [Synergistaceae bacterium OttesenSCG-928-D05]|nr:Fic family protein [Synergistaceae bacterium OttesenSCG-928-D05]